MMTPTHHLKLAAAVAAAFTFISPVVHAQNGIAAANIRVVQIDTNNTVDSVEMATTVSINGLKIRGDSNRADYNLQAGKEYSDDVSTGVLICSVAQNGRDNSEPAYPGTNFCTSTIDYTRTGGAPPIGQRYFRIKVVQQEEHSGGTIRS